MPTTKKDFEATTAKPIALDVLPAGIPEELKKWEQWICWDYRWKKDKNKWDKPPLNNIGNLASVNDLSTWSRFLAVTMQQSQMLFSGFGFVFTDYDPFCGIDLDDCRDPSTGVIEDWAAAIVARVKSYTDVSPSGTGLKIVCRAKLKGKGRKFTALGIEIYDTARYFTITGHVHDGNATIEDRQDEVNAILAELEAQTAKPKPAPAARPSNYQALLSDEEVIEKASKAANADKFADLWAGGLAGNPSASEADLSLCNILAFYVGQDWERLADLFRQSGLYRHKWDRDDYRERTCKKAIADCKTFFDPTYRKPFSNGKSASSTYRRTPRVEVGDGPIPFAKPRSGEFPIEALPACLQRFCREIARSMACPVDFPAVTILALAGAAIGNTRALEIKRGWTEGARMYIAIVSPPGSAKSPAVDAVCSPVFRRQTVVSQEWANRREIWQSQKDVYEGAKKRKDMPQAAMPTSPGAMPPETHLYTTDATTEVLSPILQNNPRGLILIRDEVTGWVAAMNQYKAGKGSDRQFWLSAWSGAASKTDRKGTLETGSVRVANPFVNVVGGIQPDMLETLCDEQAREDGFIHRILFSYPDVAPDDLWNDHGISEETEKDWLGILNRLYALEMVETEEHGQRPYFVRLTPEGKTTWQHWYNEHQRELQNEDFPNNLRGPWSKLRAYCARLALTVHYLRWAAQNETGEVDDLSEELTENVNAGSVMRAAALIDYFKTHTRRVYHQLQTTKDDDLAFRIASWLTRRPTRQCTVRDMQRAEFVKKVSEAREVIKDMADRGIVNIDYEGGAGSKILGMRLATIETDSVG